MYTSSNKGFTIITNFGCDCNCEYCITKNHPILNNAITNEEKIDWAYLELCVSTTTAPTINLSGGGDPFYNYKEHMDFYNKIYKIAQKYNKKLDIHTRIIPNDINLIKKFRKIALSIEYKDEKAINKLKELLPTIQETTQIRVVNVLNAKMTTKTCLDFIDTMHSIGIKQITFRQMFGNKNAYQNFINIKDTINIPGVLFLEDGEYHNYYFTTNNKVYPYFFGNNENDRKYWQKKYEEIEQSCN